MAKQFAQVGDLRIHYEPADYTEPWHALCCFDTHVETKSPPGS